MTNIGLYRLNLGEFCKRWTKYPKLCKLALVRVKKVEFNNDKGEVISKSKVPYRMQHQVVDSQVYLVGGFNCEDTPNIDAYALYPEVPLLSVTICNQSYGYHFLPVLLSFGVFSPDILNDLVVVMHDELMHIFNATSKITPAPSTYHHHHLYHYHYQ